MENNVQVAWVEDDYGVLNDPWGIAVHKFHAHYKGVYYKFTQYPEMGVWSLSDRKDGCGIIQEFNADTDRIDQCFDEFKKTVQVAKENGFEYRGKYFREIPINQP